MKIGIVGSGQLGWMMIQEGSKFGFEFAVLDSVRGAAASICSEFYGPEEYGSFVRNCDLVTFEFESGDWNAIKEASRQGKLLPGLISVELKTDRIMEKTYLKEKGIPVADFIPAHGFIDAQEKSARFSKSVIKVSRGGYDGKGQYVRNRGDPVQPADDTADYIVEEFVNFSHEASVIVARKKNGEMRSFPPSLNMHLHGMLLWAMSPYQDSGMTAIAENIARELDYVGVISVEFFVTDRGPIVNEFAPRVHNSGHPTLSGYRTSQFEQHVRAITDLPLGSTEAFSHAGMVNVIGINLTEKQFRDILSIDGTKIYWYGKEQRKRRKLGHVNVTADSQSVLRERIETVLKIVYNGKQEEILRP